MRKSLAETDRLWQTWRMKPHRIVLYARVSKKDRQEQDEGYRLFLPSDFRGSVTYAVWFALRNLFFRREPLRLRVEKRSGGSRLPLAPSLAEPPDPNI